MSQHFELSDSCIILWIYMFLHLPSYARIYSIKSKQQKRIQNTRTNCLRLLRAMFLSPPLKAVKSGSAHVTNA